MRKNFRAQKAGYSVPSSSALPRCPRDIRREPFFGGSHVTAGSGCHPADSLVTPITGRGLPGETSPGAGRKGERCPQFVHSNEARVGTVVWRLICNGGWEGLEGAI